MLGKSTTVALTLSLSLSAVALAAGGAAQAQGTTAPEIQPLPAPGTDPQLQPLPEVEPPAHLGRNDMIGSQSTYITVYEDTLQDIARRFSMGYVEMILANPDIDPWLPGADREVVIPSSHVLPGGARRGIVVNLPEMRLYHFREDGSITTYPVGIGREAWETPELLTRIVRMRKDPTWVPPASIRREKPELPASIGPGPDNPLGAYAMSLGTGAYVIHGTNKPSGVGRRVSSGCIRLYPEDIEALFYEAGNGVKVRIISQEIKLGWSQGELYLEAHPSEKLADMIEAGRVFDHPVDMPAFTEMVRAIPGADDADVDWDAAREALRVRSGIPVQITRRFRAALD